MFLSLFKKKPKEIAPDLSYIGTDMHSHLLFGLDDGAKNEEETVHFISQLKELGYKKLICTPHIMSGVYENNPTIIRSKLAEVKRLISEHQIDITIDAAAEYMVDYEFERKLKQKEELLTLPGNFILIEMSYASPSQNIEQIIFDLSMAGYRPILAHPERYNYYHHQYGYYTTLKSRGCLLQVNLLSLSGYYGPGVKKTAEKLLKDGLVEFVGTDMHHINHLNMTMQMATSAELKELLTSCNLWNSKL